jgi:hypothetical protein
MLFNKYLELLKECFEKPTVLDVGCGPDFEQNRNGIDFVGIDFAYSSEGIIHKDFLKHEFKRKFEGIVVKDVLHLFPLSERIKVIEKVRKLLVEGGLVYFKLKVKDSGGEFVKDLEGFRVLEKETGEKVVLGKRELEIVCEKA